MAQESSPAYQWYVKDWRSSRATQRMSFAERGVYREMLDEQWESLTLPDSPDEVADLIATTDVQRAEVLAAWSAVRRKFVTVEGGRIQNARMERGRKAKRKFEKWGKANAAAGGRARVAQAGRNTSGHFTSGIQPAPAGVHPAEPPADVQPRSGWSPPASSSSSSSSSASSSAEPSARSKRPIFSGQRLTVFEWMLDDCTKTLGNFTDAFDLHSWFFDLDAQAVMANLVIPQRDHGAWLQTQLVQECQRRGLPIASSAVAGKLTTRMAQMVANSRRPA